MKCSDIDLDTASKAIEAARRKAQEIGISEDIAVVDRGANLKALIRMDGAWQGSIDIQSRKPERPDCSISRHKN